MGSCNVFFYIKIRQTNLFLNELYFSQIVLLTFYYYYYYYLDNNFFFNADHFHFLNHSNIQSLSLIEFINFSMVFAFIFFHKFSSAKKEKLAIQILYVHNSILYPQT